MCCTVTGLPGSHDGLPGSPVTVQQLYNVRCAVQSPDCQEVMMGFLATGIMPNQASVDQAAEFITNILKHSAELSGMPVKKGAVPRHSAWTD